ncbi:MAG: ChrR family anti-sigma-E factor [Cypionkella sp.]|nr:ChrR family anti-sigma-E factor [Cypionkella sp.]
MTTIRHHLSDELLGAYAAGDLPEAFGLVVAVHLSMCDECRARSMTLETLGGAVLDTGEAVPMGEGALGAAMARLDALMQEPKAAPKRRTGVPAPLAEYIGGDLDAVRWKSVGKGVKQAILPTDRLASARLLRIPGGVAVPDHGHKGLELTLVLQGAFSDGTGRFGLCICLAATEAPLRFKGLMPRLAQPFFRI